MLEVYILVVHDYAETYRVIANIVLPALLQEKMRYFLLFYNFGNLYATLNWLYFITPILTPETYSFFY